jgi:transposase-like protein
MMPTDVTLNTDEQLRALSVSYRDAKETFEVHRDKWQNAITQAVDQGMKPADVARVVGVTPQRILAIVARVYSRDES